MLFFFQTSRVQQILPVIRPFLASLHYLSIWVLIRLIPHIILKDLAKLLCVAQQKHELPVQVTVTLVTPFIIYHIAVMVRRNGG